MAAGGGLGFGRALRLIGSMITLRAIAASKRLNRHGGHQRQRAHERGGQTKSGMTFEIAHVNQ
jgi:hypothetical protein